LDLKAILNSNLTKKKSESLWALLSQDVSLFKDINVAKYLWEILIQKCFILRTSITDMSPHYFLTNFIKLWKVKIKLACRLTIITTAFKSVCIDH
jgi:hypothetical protein